MHVLLAEDDPVSQKFLADTLHDMGFQVQCCSHGSDALKHACASRFDILLLDCRMPDFGAQTIIERLENEPEAASRGCPAIATSAEITPQVQTRLLAHGFQAVVHKPLRQADLKQALERALPGCMKHLLLDNHAALETSGSVDTMQALRGLFAAELKQLLADLDKLFEHPTQLNERLHRLRASCGFCGATALARQCDLLATRRATDASARARHIEYFHHVIHSTLKALDDAKPDSDT